MDEDVPRKGESTERTAQVARALGHRSRLELLDLLRDGERGVEQLSRLAGLGTTTASAHLQVLKAGGLVATRRRGASVLYRLASPEAAVLFARLRELAATHLADMLPIVTGYLLDDPGKGRPVTAAQLLAGAATGTVCILEVHERGPYPVLRRVSPAALARRLHGLSATSVAGYCRDATCLVASCDGPWTRLAHLRPGGAAPGVSVYGKLDTPPGDVL